MLKNIFRILLLSSVALVLSCSERRNAVVTDDSNVVAIEIEDVPKVLLDASKYVDSVKYIKLDDTPEMPIAAISEIFFTDSLLIVSEYRQKMVVFYDLDGNYLRRISKRGRGPGEYITISSVMVDEARKNVIIYDIDRRRLMFYDFDGTYIRSIDDFSNRLVIRDMINLPDGGFLCYCPDWLDDDYPGGLWYVDENGVPGEYYYRLDEKYPSHLTQYPYSLYNTSKGIGFAESVFSDIYSYDSKGLHKMVSYRLPGQNIYDAKGLSSAEAETGSMIMNAESDRFVLTYFTTGENRVGMVIFDKSDKSYEVGIDLFFANEVMLLSGSPVRNNLTGVYSKIVVPGDILYSIKNSPDNTKALLQERYASLINTLTDGASEEEVSNKNPIIQLLYLKN